MFKEIGISIFISLFAVAGRAEAQPYTTEFAKGEVTVDTIKRTSDETVLIKGSIKNTSNSDFALFASGITSYNVFAVKIQDLKSKKQFEQVKVQNTLVGSRNEESLAPGQSTKFWARVTAPPKDVTHVTILFNGSIAPIDDAVISE